MRAGPGPHCGPGPAAAPHAGRPDPAAPARSASAAHQPPHRAGGAQETHGCCLPIAWATVMSMQIMWATAVKRATSAQGSSGRMLEAQVAAEHPCCKSLQQAEPCCCMSCHGQDSCRTLTLLLLFSPQSPVTPGLQDTSLSAGWHAGAPCPGAAQPHDVAAGRQPQGRLRPAAKGRLA